MTVQDPRVPSGLTDVYQYGGYNPATYTGSSTYSTAKKQETLPDWVVNNNKVGRQAHPAYQSYTMTEKCLLVCQHQQAACQQYDTYLSVGFFESCHYTLRAGKTAGVQAPFVRAYF